MTASYSETILHRNSNGNMTFLMVLTIGVLVLIVLGGVAFNLMLSKRSQAEYAADSLVLDLATKINAGDRVGQMNELKEASRELVFVSRQHLEKCVGENRRLLGLCDDLLQEARSSNDLVEKERKNQIALIQDEVNGSVVRYNQNKSQHKRFSFLGFETQEPEVVGVDLGQIYRVNSNVRALSAIPELAEFDSRKSLFDHQSKLYRADIVAKLPSPDSDLNFSFSSLPAYVGATAAPPRNVNGNMFVPYGTIFSEGRGRPATIKQVPSAIQLQCRMNMSMPWERRSTEALALRATGTASGASLESR